MLPEKSVSAVIPSRGDVDTIVIVRHLRTYPEIDDIEVIVGATPYNRYRTAAAARHDVIFTQDDDCLTDIRPVLDAYQPGRITNAMTESHLKAYPGRQTLMGFGALFDKSMLSVFDGWEIDDLFLRESDRVFATMHPHFSVFPSIHILPWAFADNRLYRQPEHGPAHMAMMARIEARLAAR